VSNAGAVVSRTPSRSKGWLPRVARAALGGWHDAQSGVTPCIAFMQAHRVTDVHQSCVAQFYLSRHQDMQQKKKTDARSRSRPAETEDAAGSKYQTLKLVGLRRARGR
jgi:hypothetical protein